MKNLTYDDYCPDFAARNIKAQATLRGYANLKELAHDGGFNYGNFLNRVKGRNFWHVNEARVVARLLDTTIDELFFPKN